jgi:meso-butanediol dehydrogenase/(S,S)-butanediol dehydrogenase/diacetyl reductase
MTSRHGEPGATSRPGCFAITGAASGIGLRVASDMVARGHHVWCLDRDADRLADAVEGLRASGEADALALDVGDEVAVAAAFGTIGSACDGRLGGLVNSAGVLIVGRFETLEPAQWELAFRVNVLGSYLMLKHAIPLLRASPPGRVVNLASIAGKIPGAFTAPYNASKAAVISLTRSAAVALGPDILVNSVCPGPVDTPMYRQMDEGLDKADAPEDLRFARRSTMSPLGRAATVEDISAAILFLLSDAASGITGEDLNVSAGFVMH